MTPIKILYIFEILTVLGIAFGILPRPIAFLLVALIVIFILTKPLEEGVVFFVASIPLFVALPITSGFDSLSSARVIIIFLFFKWLILRNFRVIKINFSRLNLKKWLKNNQFEFFALALFLLLGASVLVAEDKIAAIKKIIYLANLSVFFLVSREVIKNSDVLKRIIRAITFSLLFVMGVAAGQLISVYFSTLGGFWEWWANHFSFGFYGENLRRIILNANTWFAASPFGPSVIRLFGSFADSHSFALYILLCAPFLVVLTFSVFKDQLTSAQIYLKKFLKLKISPAIRKNFVKRIIFLLLALFFIILSGTRGIWVGVIFGIFGFIVLVLKKKDFNRSASLVFLSLLFFIFLIPAASFYTIIPQFKDYSGQEPDATMFLKRLASVLDLEETSNSGRLYIWGESLKSLARHPLLGLGVGNFPRALDQDIALAKAGSSAHSLYLNFGVESGIFAILFLFLLFADVLKTLYRNLQKSCSVKGKLLLSGFFIYLLWVFGYCFFDIALLDERVFLLFLTILGIIYAIKRNPEIILKYE